MKRMFFLGLILILFLLSIFKVNANNLTFPLIGKTIIIDPGHGGVDQGSSHQDIKEAPLNLGISLKIKKALEEMGAVVLMTRDGDYDLSRPEALYRKKSDFDNRIKLINNSGSELYLSIHLNYYSNAVYYGPQIFYTTNYRENEAIAETLQTELNNNLNTKRKIKINSDANYMYNKLNIKGVLIECGFLSNAQERTNLITENYQEKFAKIIAQGIVKYYS